MDSREKREIHNSNNLNGSNLQKDAESTTRRTPKADGASVETPFWSPSCQCQGHRLLPQILPMPRLPQGRTFLHREASHAAVYSIIETAKANGLNPFQYLRYLFEQLPNADIQRHPEKLDEFLPWNEIIKQNCK